MRPSRANSAPANKPATEPTPVLADTDTATEATPAVGDTITEDTTAAQLPTPVHSHPQLAPVGTYRGVLVYEGDKCVQNNWGPSISEEFSLDRDNISCFELDDHVGLPCPGLDGILWGDFSDNFYLCRCMTCNFQVNKNEPSAMQCTMCSKVWKTPREYMVD